MNDRPTTELQLSVQGCSVKYRPEMYTLTFATCTHRAAGLTVTIGGPDAAIFELDEHAVRALRLLLDIAASSGAGAVGR